MKRIVKSLFVIFFIAALLSITVFAASTPYLTYTYSARGEVLHSPAAYVPDRRVNYLDMGLSTSLTSPSDIFTHNGLIYIVDTGNNRIVICDSNFKVQSTITSFVNEQGVPSTFGNPQGVFVNDDYIYVADTYNKRIVVFDHSLNFIRTYYSPAADEMSSDQIFHPVALAVDDFGRMYIVSDQATLGIMVITTEGRFLGFIGGQKSNMSAWEIIWRRFMTDAQRAQQFANVGIAYNNIAINDDGFIYVTVDLDDADIQSFIQSADPAFAPVKLLNPSGADIMLRNGFYPPAGEIMTNSYITGGNPSKIVDVASGPNGMWSLLDQIRQRIYTYDHSGTLLFVFGDKGTQLGNSDKISSICYMGSDIYALDQQNNLVTVYKRTEYGDAINDALYYSNNLDYEKSIEAWEEVLKRNNNFDAAYVGIGRNLYFSGDYEGAMRYLKAAYNTVDYSTAFKAFRKNWVQKYLFVIPLVIIAVLVGLSLLFKKAKKVNVAGNTKVGRRTIGEELFYGFHIMIHPFDGFWDLKHEKRGSTRGAFIFLIIAIITVIYSSMGQAYVFNPYKSTGFNMFFQFATVLVPVLLWCGANWCLTTLFDGEGKFSDIFIAVCYSLLPMPLLMIPATLITNVVSLDEASIVTLINAIALIWVGMLIFFGSMTVHGYSMGKNIIITFFTILGMAFIMFLIILFSNLVMRMISFVTDIVTELSYR